MADPSAFDLEHLANQPGTYFNPQTEVVIVVDDSTSIDQDIFDSAELDADWVKISDEVPIEETALDEALEEFASSYHPAGESVSAQLLDPDDAEDDPDLDRLDPDEEDDEEE